MKEIKLNPNEISKILISNINNPSTIFIFSTSTVMNSWIEYLITHADQTGTDALPLERFIAWDTFKGKYLHAEESGKSSVPSILRNFFVQDLIYKNANLDKSQRFQVIINPEDSYAREAASFADWISKNLPSLHFWKKRLDQSAETYGQLDAEDQDYEKLYQLYKDFLDKNKLFEPAWLDNLELGDKNTNFILFYPELLEDFGDYKEIFKKNDNITLCTMPDDIPNPEVYFFKDSRSELRQTILRIIQLVKDDKADWSEIALSIPDIETYRPYIEREFKLYQVPFVIKAGLSLTKNNAGQIFREINNCHKENFTFDSVRSLLLDENLPWKSEFEEKRKNLIRVGNEMRCICSPEEKDIWLSAFAKKIAVLNKQENTEEIALYEELKKFYQEVKALVEGFFTEKSFKSIKKAWFDFRRYFFTDEDTFSDEANAILGRCLSELNEIIRVEEEFQAAELHISDPFSFFLNELDKKKYSPQQNDKTGVSVFPYKLSGPACFKYQFVIDASQKNLEIPYKRLTFLNAKKRARLHLIDDDKELRASEVFIKLYAKKSYEQNTDDDFVTFSAAEETFAGFAIPHSNLQPAKNPLPDLNETDYIRNEKLYALDFITEEKPEKLTENQKEAIKNWAKTQTPCETEDYRVNEKIISNITQILIKNRSGKNIYGEEIISDQLKITARNDLELFYPCPRKWLLKSILKLKDDTLDTNLMQSYDMGNLNHKILELFMLQFKGSPLPYFDQNSKTFKIILPDANIISPEPQDFSLNLLPFIDKALLAPSDFRDSPLVIEALKKQKERIAQKLEDFLKDLLLPLEEGGIGKCILYDCEKTLAAKGDGRFDFYGKIDCLLLTPENEWIIVDYKNSAIPASKDTVSDENDLLGDFQMPVYFTLLDGENKHPVYKGTFYSINKKNSKGIADNLSVVDINHLKKGIPDKLYEQYELTIQIMKEYARDFYLIADPNPQKGSLDFRPHSFNSTKEKLNVNPYKDCPACPFKEICRTTFTIAENQIATTGADE